MIFLKKVLFISSTGGHLSELLELKALFDIYDYHIVTEKTKSNASLKDVYKDKISYLVYGTKRQLLKYLFIFSFNWIKSFFIFLKFKPDAIITTGSHTAIPMCFIAKFFRRKVIYIETFANIHTKTMAGKIAYPIADLFIVQWESMLEMYEKAVYGGWIFK